MIFNVFESFNHNYIYCTNIKKNMINQWTTVYKYDCKYRDKINIKIAFNVDEAWFLSGERELKKIEKEVMPPFPVGCLLILKSDNRYYQIDLPKYPYMKFIRNKNNIDVYFSLKDISKIGLQFWGEEKIKKDLELINFEIRIFKINSIKECKWVEPYPNGAKAAICLTDHADWDSAEKLTKLVDLFEKYNFKFTKSIFPHSDFQGYKQEPGLDNKSFKNEINRLYKMGTEIAYHGLSPRVNPPTYNECLKRIETMKFYSPTTWIDHGTGSYLYSREAKFSNGVLLVDELSKSGISNYWSYMDIWENPSINLNVWTKRTFFSALQDIFNLSLIKGRMNPKQFAYICIGMFKNIFGGSKYRQLKNIWKPSIYRHLVAHVKRLNVLHANPFVIYNENGLFALNNLNENWVFDTILLNHLALQLKPKSIDNLVKQNGLLIAHCYMGAQHKYGGSNCFNNKSENPELLSRFEENIAYISSLQKQNELVTLTFEELRKNFEKFIGTKYIREKNGWIIFENIEVEYDSKTSLKSNT